jgi:DNA-binding NarL/FixJ family response regulator/muconolactone delta-isomerase
VRSCGHVARPSEGACRDRRRAGRRARASLVISGEPGTADSSFEFDVSVPAAAPRSEVEERERGEAAAAARLAEEGHLVRIWKPPVAPGETKALGLYRAESQKQLDSPARRSPASRVDARYRHAARAPPQRPGERSAKHLSPSRPSRLTPLYRLEATLGQPFDLNDTVQAHRRIVPLTGGTFMGPEINGKLIGGASTDWQIVLPDGTARQHPLPACRPRVAICSTSSPTFDVDVPFPELTGREREILDLMAAGLANAEIAQRLHLSPKTVSNNITLIFDKLQVADRAKAIVRARREGLGRVD